MTRVLIRAVELLRSTASPRLKLLSRRFPMRAAAALTAAVIFHWARIVQEVWHRLLPQLLNYLKLSQLRMWRQLLLRRLLIEYCRQLCLQGINVFFALCPSFYVRMSLRYILVWIPRALLDWAWDHFFKEFAVNNCRSCSSGKLRQCIPSTQNHLTPRNPNSPVNRYIVYKYKSLFIYPLQLTCQFIFIALLHIHIFCKKRAFLWDSVFLVMVFYYFFLFSYN